MRSSLFSNLVLFSFSLVFASVTLLLPAAAIAGEALDNLAGPADNPTIQNLVKSLAESTRTCWQDQSCSLDESEYQLLKEMITDVSNSSFSLLFLDEGQCHESRFTNLIWSVCPNTYSQFDLDGSGQLSRSEAFLLLSAGYERDLKGASLVASKLTQKIAPLLDHPQL